MKCIKILGYSIYKTSEIEPVIEVIEDSKQLNTKNKELQKRIHELEHILRVCNQLLDASQQSVTQLNRR